MRVRDWQDILDDVVEHDADPQGWRAVGGDRDGGLGEDLFLGHPSAGVFQLKTYARNPFQVEGVGSKVARKIDEDLDPLFPTSDSGSGHFGVQQPVTDEDEAEQVGRRLETVLETHADAPTTPEALFEDVMDALDSPAYGPMEFDNYGRPESMEDLAETFEEAESVLDAELEDLIDETVSRGFH